MVKIIAHRGSSGTAPENTMLAFEKAVRDGADGIETDVRKTKDGVLVISHDSHLSRLNDEVSKDLLVTESNYDDIKDIDISSKRFPDLPVQHIAKLSGLLQLVKDTGVPLNIEIKPNPRTDDLLELDIIKMVAEYGVEDKVFYSCFAHSVLANIKAHKPEAPVAPLYSNSPWREWEYAKTFGAFAVHPEWRDGLLRGNFKECRKAGLDVNVWTVNDAKDVPALIEAGATGLITNYPVEIRRAAEEYFGK